MSSPRKHSRAIRVITSVSVGVVSLSAIGWLGLGRVSGSLNRTDAFANIKNRPDKPTSAMNLLLVGSDNREGLTKDQIRDLWVGGTEVAAGQRSDTMLLVHISKARDSAVIVSLPRDSLVTIPEHVSSADKTKIVPARQNKLNAAFSFGGAPLLIETLEGETGLRIDHYIEINFLGFDERFIRAQDWELNFRLRERGGKIYFDPRLEVTYRPRPNLAALGKQYFEYGRWRRVVSRKHAGTINYRYLAPPLALAGTCLSIIAGFVVSPLLYVPAGIYAGFTLIAGIALGKGLLEKIMMPAVLVTMQMAWGAGFITSPKSLVPKD